MTSEELAAARLSPIREGIHDSGSCEDGEVRSEDKFGGEHYVKTSNRSRGICNGPLTPITCTHICNGCCFALVTYKRDRPTLGLASTTPVTNVAFW
jgi:hypothetical protein